MPMNDMSNAKAMSWYLCNKGIIPWYQKQFENYFPLKKLQLISLNSTSLDNTKLCQEIRNNFTESFNIRLIKLKAFQVQESKDFVYDYYYIERSRMLPSLFFIRWAFSSRQEKCWSAWRWLASFNVLLCKWNVFMDIRVGYPNKSYFHIFLSKDVLGAHLKCLKKPFWL